MECSSGPLFTQEALAGDRSASEKYHLRLLTAFVKVSGAQSCDVT